MELEFKNEVFGKLVQKKYRAKPSACMTFVPNNEHDHYTQLWLKTTSQFVMTFLDYCYSLIRILIHFAMTGIKF